MTTEIMVMNVNVNKVWHWCQFIFHMNKVRHLMSGYIQCELSLASVSVYFWCQSNLASVSDCQSISYVS